MKKISLALAALSLPLASCASLQTLPVQAPAVCSKTTIDDVALETAWKGFDVALDAVNLMIDLNVIKINSPKAGELASLIRRTNSALQAASAANDACNASDYVVALAQARTAMAQLQVALKGPAQGVPAGNSKMPGMVH